MGDQESVVREVFLHWLRETHGYAFQAGENGDGTVQASNGDQTLALNVRALVQTDDAGWLARRARVEELIAEDLPAGVALWIPAGAELPADEPTLGEFLQMVRQSAVKLGPHERSYVALPARLLLRKNSDSGGVISVTGGLNPFWAQFTGKVRGSYDLDSNELHRLPESGEHLEQLIAAVIAASETLEVGAVAEIRTIDAWTVQRISGDSGVTILGVPPGQTVDLGLAVRRNLRRVLQESIPGLRERTADLRALVVWAPYARVEHEGATTALRGYDPGSYSGADYVCLAVDGLVKPMIQPPQKVVPV